MRDGGGTMQRIVFAAGGREYSWTDVITAAKARGAWGGIAAQRPAAADPRALERWRRERRLLSADETHAWLARWDLGVRDVRHFLGIAGPSPGATPDRDGWVAAVCSGAHEALASDLAARVALAPEPPAADAPLDAEALARLEQSYQRHLQDSEVRDVPRVIGEHADDWARVQLASLSLPARDAAQEALLCLRSDGVTCEELAEMTGVDVERSCVFIDQLDAELRPLALGGVPGDVLGPFQTGSAHRVVQLVARGTDPDDPEVLARARALALELAIARSPVRLEWRERF